MNTRIRVLVLLGVVGAASVHAAAQAPTFDRYEVILARMPFGAEPVVPPPGALPAAPTTPAESFTKNLRMCAVTRHALTGLLQVGLIDSATKKNYFIGVGQDEDGITVVDADYEGERALLRKGTEEVWISMKDAVAAPAPSPVAGPAVAGGPAMAPRRLSFPRRDAPVRVPPQSPGETNLTGEALTKHLEQYQMDLIRSRGEKGPPLPMELTPEMDAQLVKEGVLPPVE